MCCSVSSVLLSSGVFVLSCCLAGEGECLRDEAVVCFCSSKRGYLLVASSLELWSRCRFGVPWGSGPLSGGRVDGVVSAMNSPFADKSMGSDNSLRV